MKLLIALFAGLALPACAPPLPEVPNPIAAIDYEAIEARLASRPARGKTTDDFPDVLLTDQHGQTYRFFEDLIRDRSVVVNFMFTQCALICPGTTSHLVRLHQAFHGAVGRDLRFLSISLDPDHDTPEVLHAYWEAFGGHEGWLYLRGDYEETELLRRRMGVYDLDPVIDADKTQHSGILTFGNDATDRWAALPALSTIVDLKETITRFALSGKTRLRRSLASRSDDRSEKIYRSHGTIRSAPNLRREILLEHEEVLGLMPAMTMTFAVSQEIPLQDFSVGQRVEFGVVNEPSGFRIVELKPSEQRTSSL